MRPEFHFTARKGWINDPHGTTFRGAHYETFFQYVPDSTIWAPNCHWGHARGDDLLSLTELPVAIAPDDGDEGIWTGSLVTDDEGSTRAFYTSIGLPDSGIGRVRLATPVDTEWIEWQKGDVAVEAPPGLQLVAYRDPFVMRDGDCWRMFVGASLAGGTAMALSYRSDDLSTWAYEGIALERSTGVKEPVWMGTLWECPQIIDVDGRHVMISSVWDNDQLHYAGYAVGRYANGTFNAEAWGQLTHGPSYYAPSFFRDGDGRPCLTFWMRGVQDLDAGWSGAHSVPHVLSLHGDTLVASPHPDVEKYRNPSGGGTALDVVWNSSGAGRLLVNRGQEAVLTLRVANGELSVVGGEEVFTMPVADPIRIILDCQAVEISSSRGCAALALASGDGAYFVDTESEVSTWALSR